MRILALAVFVFSVSAKAINVESQAIKDQSALRSVSVEVDNGPALAAVQPTAHLKFQYASCSKRNFSAETKSENGVMFVTILDANKGDCRSMPRDRSYSVQISSDFRTGTQVVVLNPVSQTTR